MANGGQSGKGAGLRGSPEKQSMREAMVHLLARYLEIRPLFLAAARPMKVEWKMSPYLGVLPRDFRALGAHGRVQAPILSC